jgi:uncharacterized protein (DUF2267 family)
MTAKDGDPGSEHAKTSAIRGDIERTRDDMSRTVNEIEERLSPAHIKDQVAELKASVLGEYHDAKEHLKEDISRELREAKEKVQEELLDAKEKINGEIQHARTAVREATVGRVEHMVHDARDTVTDAGTTVLDTIKANPVPTALIAVGLGWLIVSARSDKGSDARRSTGYRRELDYGGTYDGSYDDDRMFGGERHQASAPRRALREGQRLVGDAVHSAEEGAASIGRRVRSEATHLAEHASGVAHDVGEKVNHLAHDAAHGVEHLAADARMQGRRMVDGAGAQARRAEQTFESTLRENPLAVGAVAIALGAAIGLVLPHTQKEDEWMGQVKDRLVHRAEGAAQGALRAAEETVTHRLEAGERSATKKLDDEVPTTERNGLSNGTSSKEGSKTSSPHV